MAGYYYKISVNGTESDETNNYNDIAARWKNIADTLEGRGGHAVLYRRSVHNKSIMELLTDPSRWLVIGDKAFGPHEIFAELTL